jgi:hypothetical protein
VVRVLGYRSRDLGSIPGASRFSEKQWVWNGIHSASWVQLISYLEEKVAAPVWKTENTVVRIIRADHATPLYPQKVVTNEIRSRSFFINRTNGRYEKSHLKMCRQVGDAKDLRAFLCYSHRQHLDNCRLYILWMTAFHHKLLNLWTVSVRKWRTVQGQQQDSAVEINRDSAVDGVNVLEKNLTRLYWQISWTR